MGGNLGNALVFLVDTLFGLYIIVLLLRYILQLVRADFYNPLAQFVWQTTNPVAGLLARIVPRWHRHDLAAVVLAYALALVNISVDLALVNLSAGAVSLLWWALLKLVMLTCNLYFFSILVQAVMSWFGPAAPTPASAFLWSINEPLLRPVRNLLPPLGGLDLSPLVLLIALQMLNLLLPLPTLLR